MTIPSFEDQLAAVSGTIRSVNMWNFYDRYHDGLLYYWNNAEKLRNSAQTLWQTQPYANDVAFMLAGLSIELLVKGTILALQGSFPHCHRLDCLIATAGIQVEDKDHHTSRLLTEYIVWAARYPTPRRAEDWFLRETGGWPLSRVTRTKHDNDKADYERLWETLAPYFWRVNEATYESADMDLDEFGTLRDRAMSKHEHVPRRI